MNAKYLWFAVLSLLLVMPAACTRDYSMGPMGSGGSGGGGTPASGPTTFMVSTGSSGSSLSGYIYTCTGGSNGTGGVLSLNAHVGDVIILPGSSFHPLYF